MVFTEISRQENDRFTKTHPKGHLFQSSRWAALKGRWEPAYIGGFDDDGRMRLSCVLLTRKILCARIAYIPRGPVCAFTDHDLLQEFIGYLKDYCKKKRISFTVFDPDVPVRVNGVPAPAGKAAANVLRRCGLRQKRTNRFEQIQAGSVYRIRWEHDDTPDATEEKLFAGFDPKTRYNIRVAQRRGLSVEIYDRTNLNEDALGAFCRLMRETARRDHFVPRGDDYFAGIIERLYPNVKLFLVRYDPQEDQMRTREQIQKLRAQTGRYQGGPEGKKAAEKCAQIEKQLQALRERCERIQPLLKEGPIYLAGSIMAYWGDKSWYLYGASADRCRDTMPNYLLQWEMIRYSVGLGLRMYDQRGVPASPSPRDPLYGLYRFKKGFGGGLEEFPGSFYLVRNPLVYWLYCATFTRFKAIRNLAQRLIRNIQSLVAGWGRPIPRWRRTHDEKNPVAGCIGRRAYRCAGGCRQSPPDRTSTQPGGRNPAGDSCDIAFSFADPRRGIHRRRAV
jgi:peptidoglycan pentaglycine glycine transferase (the first glycine)